MNDWFRSWHGAPTDPKWLGIARKANVAAGKVVSVVWALMDRASQASERGTIEGYDAEGLAYFFGYEPEEIEAIVSALRDKGVIEGNRFTSWEKRQPKREDDNSTARVRAYRDRKRQEQGAENQSETNGNAPTRIHAQGNAVKRNETEGNAMERMKRNETANVFQAGQGASIPVHGTQFDDSQPLEIQGIESCNTVKRTETLDTDTETEESKKEESCTKTRRRVSYPDQFEEFWTGKDGKPGYPTDPGMSKAEAYSEWQKLSPDDRQSAIDALPGFRIWLKRQPADYRIIHACRFLSKRRFDGFAEQEQTANSTSAKAQVAVIEGSPQWAAWTKHRGKAGPVTDIRTDSGPIRRGWWFPTEWPPVHQRPTVGPQEPEATDERPALSTDQPEPPRPMLVEPGHDDLELPAFLRRDKRKAA